MQRRTLIVIAGGLLVFLLAYFSINTDAGSDPKLTLVVSQALVDTGTPFLDIYQNDDLLDRPFAAYVDNGDILLQSTAHFTNYFPLGPSLISAPFVAVARGLGYDMRTTDNYALQRLLSALTVALVFFLAYALSRTYLDGWPSLVLALIAVLGSSLLSTLGTALWSHNYAVLAAGGALLLLVREREGNSSSLHPVLLGLLLFLCFLNRPSLIAFIVPVLVYVLWRDRRAFLTTALVSGGLLLGYLAWNAAATGSFLPAYFSTNRLQVERSPLWVGIVGNLVSPSRGLLIFSPFLLPVLLGYGVYWRSLLRRPIVRLCLVWFGLQLIIVAQAASWWGGWSFGPRLLTDIWPGLIVLTAILGAFLRDNATIRAQRLFVGAFLALGMAAIVVHVGQGLNSQSASRWNGFIRPVPADDSTLGDLFNWRYAQPVANSAMLCAIERDSLEPFFGNDLPLTYYAVGQSFSIVQDISRWELPKIMAEIPRTIDPVPATSAAAPSAHQTYIPVLSAPGHSLVFSGWSSLSPYGDELDIRWSYCRDSEIWLKLTTDPTLKTLALVVTGLTYGPQTIEVAINDQPLGTMQWSGELETQTLAFPAALLPSEGLTRLQFTFPNAHRPNLQDQRPLGLALVGLGIGRPGAERLVLPSPEPPTAAYPP